MTASLPDFFRRLLGRRSEPHIAHAKSESLEKLEETVGYCFNDRSLLVRSLAHRSYAVGGQDAQKVDSSNERLEFLGDAVLSLVVNDFLYKNYPEKREGELTKMKSVLVSKAILSHYAKLNNLGDFILMSPNAQRSRVAETESVLADTLEAIFGAVFLDGGFKSASSCILRLLLSDLKAIFYSEDNINYKSLLQEYIQALHKVPPRYQVRGTSGPEHDKEFAVEVGVRGTILARGVGKTKKLAEQEAAKAAYKKLLNTDGVVGE